MKAVAHSHVWWPGIDRDIEERARGCKQCLKTRKAPQAAPLFPWSWPTAPRQYIHVDFATHQSNHHLIIVDAHSKRPEVIGPMNTTTAEATANAMRNIFARYGLPNQIISDNGPPFQSAENEEFLRQNGIQRILVSPYHPTSNGLADPSCTLQQKIQDFLLSYRSTQHATTGLSPAKLFLQRELRTRLSLVRPDLATVSCQQEKMKMHHDKHAKFREIAVGDSVLAHDHLSGKKWPPGTIVQHPSSHSCQVHLDDGRVWRQHLDDILQNNSHSKTAESGVPSLETASPVVPDPQPVISPEISPHPPVNSAQLETTPTSTSPVLRRSSLAHRPPQRLIDDEM